jgi:D-alanyl-lipoteichoic acid acyltransferase DltB (MBOAT superfamily)
VFADLAAALSQLTFVEPLYLFGFVPLAVLGYVLALRWGGSRAGVWWLIAVSLAFYATWGARYLLVLLASLAVNTAMRHLLLSDVPLWRSRRRAVLIATIAFNLGLLGYFKYRYFFGSTVAPLFGTAPGAAAQLAIPLGISFYTFQQITLAVDVYRGAYGRDYARYWLYVLFFPHLVAGPLVHHREMVPQFRRLGFRWNAFMAGIVLLSLGLFKKLCIADPLAPVVAEVFDAPAGQALQFWRAWVATLAYTMQLYFDFSGYSDMALGLARLFGVRLPINFNSPYKAASIIDFWRRWHITLSRFLRESLYFPLGGNRRGPVRRYANLMIVMVLGGLWHGAGWTFVAWGALHGLYLAVNHAWIALRGMIPRLPSPLDRGEMAAGQIVTFVAVAAAWVPFRAPDFAAATKIWAAMAGANGAEAAVRLPDRDSIERMIVNLQIPSGPGEYTVVVGLWLLLLYAACLALPNSMQIGRVYFPFPGRAEDAPRPAWLRWRPTLGWGLFCGALLGLAMMAQRELPSAFLYWNF